MWQGSKISGKYSTNYIIHLYLHYSACDRILHVHTAHGPANSEGSAVWSSKEGTISCTSSRSNIDFTKTIKFNYKALYWNTGECIITVYIPLHYKNDS